jgi:hypothetical protein
MLQRIAVHLGRGRQQKFSLGALRQTQHVHGTNDGRFNRFHRIKFVVNRRGWARQVVHFIDFEQDRFDDVVTNKLKVFLPEMVFDVVFGSSKERICSRLQSKNIRATRQFASENKVVQKESVTATTTTTMV